MVLDIVKDPNTLLHKKCKAVKKDEFGENLNTLLDNMIETLRTTTGVGLAAPQVGVLKRLVIILDQDNKVIELINPKIIWEKGESYGFEGCLSLPNQWGKVERCEKIKVRAQDRNGEYFDLVGEEVIARCISHEIEHLDGHLFTEHVDRIYTREEMERIRDSQNN